MKMKQAGLLYTATLVLGISMSFSALLAPTYAACQELEPSLSSFLRAIDARKAVIENAIPNAPAEGAKLLQKQLKALTKARKKIEKVLPRDCFKTFRGAAKAIKSIQKAFPPGDPLISDYAASVCEDVAFMSSTTIHYARRLGDTLRVEKNIRKFTKRIDKVQDLFSRGDSYSAEGDFSRAVLFYSKAYKAALSARRLGEKLRAKEPRGQQETTLTDSSGNPTEEVDEGTPAVVKLDEYEPYTQYDITVTDSNAQVVSYLRLTTDKQGNLPLTVLAYDMETGNYAFTVEKVIKEPAKGAVPKESKSLETSQQFSVAPVTDLPKASIVDFDEQSARSFLHGETVYVKGSGFQPDAEVHLYVVEDIMLWEDGEYLRDVSGLADEPTTPPNPRGLVPASEPEVVTTDAQGNLLPTAVWTIPTFVVPGKPFDIVADANTNGKFDEGIDVVNDDFTVGFVVQGEPTRQVGHFLAQLACDENLLYRDLFIREESVYIYINPSVEMALGEDRWVKKYIVTHKENWYTGDVLTDVSGLDDPWEADTVESGCTNEGRVLVYPGPMRPGVYDAIIDVNRNDQYDEGIDILDGGVDGPGFEVIEVGPQGPTKKWTVMVYLNADDAVLESSGIEDVNEMEQVGSSDDVNIVVQIDRIDGHDSSNGDWTTTRRYYVTQDSDDAVINSQLVADIGEQNMGDYRTLIHFANWASSNYPADNYLLVIWDHGGGFRAREARAVVKNISWDSTSGGASISIPELAQALHSIKTLLGKRIEIVGMDACLMAMLEVAYEIRDTSLYMVGSEELEPGDGWPYEEFLQRIVNNPDVTPSQVAQGIVDDYVDSYIGLSEVTLSALDLSRVQDLATKADALAQAMIDAMDDPEIGSTVTAKLRDIRNNTQKYDSVASPTDDDLDDFRDLYHFVDLITQDTELPDSTRTPAEEVKSSVNNAVLSEGHTGDSVDNSHGISVWLPNSRYFSNQISTYNDLAFTIDTQWERFLARLWGILLRIELTWGQEPDDLDSHLWDIYGNHLYYPAAGIGHSPIPGAWLDRDDTDSYGPENIRIEYLQLDADAPHQFYSYGVYLYGGYASQETVTVKVFEQGKAIPNYTFTKPGFTYAKRWWYVFDIEPSTGKIIEKDEYVSPRSLGAGLEHFAPK